VPEMTGAFLFNTQDYLPHGEADKTQ